MEISFEDEEEAERVLNESGIYRVSNRNSKIEWLEPRPFSLLSKIRLFA